MKPDLIVVARRWDGLGGRLHAILNAWSVAKALGQEFRFVWPRQSSDEHSDCRELFSDAFLDRFEITRSGCKGRAKWADPTRLTLSDARKLCDAATSRSMIEISECFGVLAFADEPKAVAQARFRDGLSEIGWSRALAAQIEAASDGNARRAYSAIHIRAGDIVTGEWRQFVPVEKYMPTPYIEFAIETLSGVDRSPVVVVSDNGQYVRHLESRFDTICRPGELIAGYDGLTESQRAFSDILTLSRAQRIVGPRASAFSQLAASLAGLTIHSADSLMAEDDARRRLRDGIARAEDDVKRSNALRPLLARDICWFLDVFSDEMPLGEQVALAQQATRLEPDFCGSLNRLTAALAMAGCQRESNEASLRAQSAAAKARRRHADPVVESLATSISANLFALGADRRRPRTWERFGLKSLGRLVARCANRNPIPRKITRRFRKCKSLAPYQIDNRAIVTNLRFQIAAWSWLIAADDPLRAISKATIAAADREPLFLQSWRPSGFSRLHRPGAFPQALRNLERQTIQIARGIGAGLASASSAPPRFGNVDSVTTSASGLRWISGWAYDPDIGGSSLAVGFLCNGVVASGGVTFLPRPDIAAALNDRRAKNCGFSFPLPLVAPDAVQDFHRTIRTA